MLWIYQPYFYRCHHLCMPVLLVDEAPYSVGQCLPRSDCCRDQQVQQIQKIYTDIPLTNATPQAESATTTTPPEAGVPAEATSSGHETTLEDSQGVYKELRDLEAAEDEVGMSLTDHEGIQRLLRSCPQNALPYPRHSIPFTRTFHPLPTS
jgi:hypothetical protein